MAAVLKIHSLESFLLGDRGMELRVYRAVKTDLARRMLPVILYRLAAHYRPCDWGRTRPWSHRAPFCRECRTDFERGLTSRLIFVWLFRLRINGYLHIAIKGIAHLVECNGKLFLQLPIIHYQRLEILKALNTDSVLFLHTDLLRGADDEESADDSDKHKYADGAIDDTRAQLLTLPVTPEVGEEMHEAESCHEQHCQHLEEESRGQVFALQIGIEEDDEVDNNS